MSFEVIESAHKILDLADAPVILKKKVSTVVTVTLPYTYTG